MPSGSTLVQEKLEQAAEILRAQDIDLWLTFVRETSLTSRVGISVGWGDKYKWSLPFQWVDVTGLPPAEKCSHSGDAGARLLRNWVETL